MTPPPVDGRLEDRATREGREYRTVADDGWQSEWCRSSSVAWDALDCYRVSLMENAA